VTERPAGDDVLEIVATGKPFCHRGLFQVQRKRQAA